MSRLDVIDLGQTANSIGIHVIYQGNDRRDNSFIDVDCIAYHRNGVCGDPFFVVTFATNMIDGTHHFVATCFFAYNNELNRYENYSMPKVAMLDRDLLTAGDVVFGSNSWRGDRFADMLLAACQAWSDRN